MKKDTVARVVWSAALKMHDQNLIVLPRALADEGTPVIINNACVSWHRLAKNLIFGNARAYVGTLFPVMPAEAQEVIIKLLGKHFDKPLPAALWSSQREVYGHGLRRPYIATGVYPQRLRITRQDVVGRLVSRLSGTLAAWKRNLATVDPNDGPKMTMTITRATIAYYEEQLIHFRRLAEQ